MRISPILSLIAGAALLTGCASNESTTSAPASAPATRGGGSSAASAETRNDGQRGEWNRTPEIGMTRADVRTRYGDPASITYEDHLEVWHYDAKRRGRDFIPVYGGFTRQYKGGSIKFDANHRVVAHRWGTKRWFY